MLNRVELIGGLKGEPALEEPGGYPVARFTLVIPEVRWNPDTRKDDVRPHYIGCMAVGNMALQVMVESMQSGEKIYVLGHLDQAEIPTEDGGKDRKTRVRVDLFHRLQAPPRVPDL